MSLVRIKTIESEILSCLAQKYKMSLLLILVELVLLEGLEKQSLVPLKAVRE